MKKIFIAIIIGFFSAGPGAAQAIRFITYNIRLDLASDAENSWSKRKDFLASQIKFYEPGIFGVQEALPNQVGDLDMALKYYGHVGIGREGKGRGEASAIFFDRRVFKVLEENTFWLSETPEKVSKGWDAAYIRICTYALFKDKRRGINIWVFNTHLDNIGEIARRKGLEIILAKIKEVNKRSYPVVLMGDFNAEPGSEVIENLRRSMKDMRDFSSEKPFGPSGTFNAFKHNQPVKKQIDYIFMDSSGRIKVKKFAVLSDSIDLRYPSDHLPVFAEITVSKK